MTKKKLKWESIGANAFAYYTFRPDFTFEVWKYHNEWVGVVDDLIHLRVTAKTREEVQEKLLMQAKKELQSLRAQITKIIEVL